MFTWPLAASIDWATVASAATAVGTLVLALATFSVVRSGRRSAQATETALMAGIRPMLLPSRLEDSEQKVSFADDHWVHVGGGRAVAEATTEAIYLVMSVRNVGNGLAVLDRWDLDPSVDRPGHTVEAIRHAGQRNPRDIAQFRRLTRDLYVPAGDLGFWQGALRDPSEPLFTATSQAIAERRPMMLDLLYGDQQGGQRTISRFTFRPVGADQWLAIISRHFNIDRPDPR
jgi:hypothetical protein